MNVATAITKLVAADALPMVVENLVIGNLVHREYDAIEANEGDTVNIPVPDGSRLDNVDIKLIYHWESTFQIPDITKILAVPDLLPVYMQPVTLSIAEAIEISLLKLYSNFTINEPVGVPGIPITEDTVDQAETRLFEAKVPMSAPKYLVVSVQEFNLLRKIPRFTEYANCAEAGINVPISGPVGRLKNFFVFRSHHVQKTGSLPVSTHNLAFCKEAMALVIRRLPRPVPGTGVLVEYTELGNFSMRVTMNYKPNSLQQTFTIEMLCGCGVLRNRYAVQVNS